MVNPETSVVPTIPDAPITEPSAPPALSQPELGEDLPMVSQPAPTGSPRRNPPVTMEECTEPDDDPSNNFDGLQVPEEDLFRDPDDLYACGHNDKDDSEAAQQFAQWSDQQFMDYLKRELGDVFDEEIQAVCE